MQNTLVAHSITQKPVRKAKRVAILGSTGTIGRNTIKLIDDHPEDFSVEALTASNSVEMLAGQARRLHAKTAVIENKELYFDLKEALMGTEIEAMAGMDSIIEVAGRETDIVIAGIVGSASMAPTMAAIRRGSTIGLANKECLVCAGELMINEVKKYNAHLIPVDSEHNSVFQSLDSKNFKKIEKITLTASGGPFRTFTQEQMAEVTPQQAVNHPNWKMGAKISVDSATMMNKGLEVIEAYHLFPVNEDQIDVLVHPESIIHSIVSYADGSCIAGMSNPDMCVPIAYALGWPKRLKTETPRLDLAEIGKLTFETPDEEKFPALKLTRQAMKTGGTATAILNAANEVAVENFICGAIKFLDIVRIVEETLSILPAEKLTSLDQLEEIDTIARQTARELINKTGRV